MEPYVYHMNVTISVDKRYQAIEKFELCLRNLIKRAKRVEHLKFLLKMFHIGYGFYRLISRYGELFSFPVS